MRPFVQSIAAVLALFFILQVTAQEVVETETHRLEQVAEGVYFAVGNGTLYTMSNALII